MDKGVQMPRIVKSKFDEQFSIFSSQLKQMAERIVEQSKNGSNIPIPTGLSNQIDEVLNNTIGESKRFLDGSLWEAVCHESIEDGFKTIEENLVSSINNAYETAIDKFSNKDKDKDNVFQLPPQELKEYKEKEKAVYNESNETKNNEQKDEKKLEQSLDENVII